MRKPINYQDRAVKLGIEPSLAAALLNAHQLLYGASEKGTQERAWQCVRKLVRCMIQLKLNDSQRFPKFILKIFYDWLAQTEIAESSKRSDFMTIRTILQWCERNMPNSIEDRLYFEHRTFYPSKPKVGRVLSEAEARLVMQTALREIEEITSRIHQGRLEVVDQATDRAKLIKRLLEIGKGKIPLQSTVNISKECLAARVRDAGGLKLICRQIFPTPRDLLPFYIAIQFQLAGNPQAVAKIKRNCIEENELRSDREWIIWDKPRSARIQRADFPAGKATAAPALIKQLSDITEPLTHINAEVSDYLFIAYERGKVGRPSLQTWHNLLNDFAKQHNLPEFSFVQLRRTSAVLHHEAAGSILIARQRLNHASVATTVRYSSYENIGEFHDRMVNAGQEDLYKEAVFESERTVKGSQHILTSDTVFGFRCSDPFAGHIGSAEPGRPCDHFHRCATCPGALIPLDQPNVISAIIRSRDSLLNTKERATKEGWLPRFIALYQTTLDVIINELLPNVPAHVYKASAEMAETRPFPTLE